MDLETAFQQRLEAAYALAEASLEGAFGEQRDGWIHRLVVEHDHLTTLLQELLERQDPESGFRLISLLQELWFEPQYTTECLEWLKRFLALSATQSRTAFRASGLDMAGACALNLGNYTEARQLKEEALDIFRECGSPLQIAYTLFHLGHLSGLVYGDFHASRDYYKEGLEVLRAAGHKEGITHGMANMGSALVGMDEARQAVPFIAESLRDYREIGSLFNMELSLRRVAAVAARLGMAEMALRLAGASEKQRLALGVSEPEVFLQAYEHMLEPARRQLDDASQARLRAEGGTWSLDEAVMVALKILAEVEEKI